MNQKTFGRVPTCGENDVDLRLPTEKTMKDQEKTALMMEHAAMTLTELQKALSTALFNAHQANLTVTAQAAVIQSQAGELGALTAEVTHLAEKLAERDVKVGGSVGELVKRLRHIANEDVTPYFCVNVPKDDLRAAANEIERLSVSAPSEEMIGISDLCALLPGPYYMDPPDGGDTPVMEQLRRMAEDAAKHRAVPQPVDAAQAVPEDVRERLRDALSIELGNSMDCKRAWSAWGVGTMSEGDFRLLADNDERLDDLVGVVLTALAAPSPAAQPAAQGAVPEGFVLAPIEPTDDMCDAPDVSIGGCYSCSAQLPTWGEHAEIYQKMIAAAPVAQPTDTTQEKK